MRATYHMSDYIAEVSIKYASTFYTINYADSKRMRYKRGSIHPTYNNLIKALQANIIRNLKPGNYTAQNSIAAPSTSTSSVQDDARAKLLKLQKPHEDGLITKEEYEAKCKVLIESY